MQALPFFLALKSHSGRKDTHHARRDGIWGWEMEWPVLNAKTWRQSRCWRNMETPFFPYIYMLVRNKHSEVKE